MVLRVRVGPFWRDWVAEHCDYQAGRQFCDVQVRGPFARWRHTHRVEAEPEGCRLEDCVEYALPGGRLGCLLGGALTRRKLARLFTYRHEVTVKDILSHRQSKRTYPEGRPMKVLVSGASGLLGSALVPFLTTGGHSVVRLARAASANQSSSVSQADSIGEQIVWSPDTGDPDPRMLEGMDAVVHLAGENITSGRWTARFKRLVRDSRVIGTQRLCNALARCVRPPKVFLCASAIGYYGSRGAERLTEESSAGDGFLADVCRDWEAATEGLAATGSRIVCLRIGVVLSPAGGALKKMLLPFQLGLGGVIGNGNQYMSWIALDDVVGAIHHALLHDAVSGPVNVVSPQPVTNRDYTRTLGKVLARPTVLPVPAFAARLALGEAADALLLASTRVEPALLTRTGYEFRYPTLDSALRHLLGKEESH